MERQGISLFVPLEWFEVSNYIAAMRVIPRVAEKCMCVYVVGENEMRKDCGTVVYTV